MNGEGGTNCAAGLIPVRPMDACDSGRRTGKLVSKEWLDETGLGQATFLTILRRLCIMVKTIANLLHWERGVQMGFEIIDALLYRSL